MLEQGKQGTSGRNTETFGKSAENSEAKIKTKTKHACASSQWYGVRMQYWQYTVNVTAVNPPASHSYADFISQTENTFHAVDMCPSISPTTAQ